MPNALPASMRFIDITTPGPPESLRLSQTTLPSLGPQDVLIRVRAAGINRPDIQQRKGLYPPPPGASPILGLEAAGEIAACGVNVTSLKLGDHVTALCNGGGYAEYVAVPAGQCLPWPKNFTAIQAAALPENYFTVWANLFGLGHLAPGESLLVHGGSSGIGITAIQLAIAHGAKVYATAGSAEKCAVIESLGATAINYHETDFAAVIATATSRQGVDVILDMIGADYAPRNIASLARGGRLVIIAFMSGNIAEKLNLTPILVKSLTITGSAMRPRKPAEKAAIAQALLTHVWPQLEAGLCTPIIHAVFPLEQAAQAHALMESSRHIGKIMLDISG